MPSGNLSRRQTGRWRGDGVDRSGPVKMDAVGVPEVMRSAPLTDTYYREHLTLDMSTRRRSGRIRLESRS